MGVNTSGICLTRVVELGGGEFVVFYTFTPPATSCIRKLSITYKNYGFVHYTEEAPCHPTVYYNRPIGRGTHKAL